MFSITWLKAHVRFHVLRSLTGFSQLIQREAIDGQVTLETLAIHPGWQAAVFILWNTAWSGCCHAETRICGNGSATWHEPTPPWFTVFFSYHRTWNRFHLWRRPLKAIQAESRTAGKEDIYREFSCEECWNTTDQWKNRQQFLKTILLTSVKTSSDAEKKYV